MSIYACMHKQIYRYTHILISYTHIRIYSYSHILIYSYIDIQTYRHTDTQIYISCMYITYYLDKCP